VTLRRFMTKMTGLQHQVRRTEHHGRLYLLPNNGPESPSAKIRRYPAALLQQPVPGVRDHIYRGLYVHDEHHGGYRQLGVHLLVVLFESSVCSILGFPQMDSASGPWVRFRVAGCRTSEGGFSDACSGY
jgi:hypothetical protein